MRRFGKVDRNHTEIVAALRKIGATVRSLASVGKGCPDLVVGYGGVNVLLEVKDGKKPPSAQKLTPDEETFVREWRGRVVVVTSVEDAVRVVTQIVSNESSH